VERIIAHTKKITETRGKRFEDLNVKLVSRVFLDWNDGTGSKKNPEHWPADLHTFDFLNTLLKAVRKACSQSPCQV
jgi:hypothetical protein